jgi:hypothetical protein
MRALVLTILTAIALTSPLQGLTLRPEPDFSFAWNTTFWTAEVVDSIAVIGGSQGIITARIDPVSYRFSPADHYELQADIDHIIVSDSAIAAVYGDDSVYFLDRSALPSITVLGRIGLPDSTWDVAMRGREMYVAGGYRGLLHGHLDTYSSLTITDSSQIGVHVVALQLVGDRLLVADDYNGMLEYSIAPTGAMEFVSRLDLSFPCDGITMIGDSALISGGSHNLITIAVKSNPQGWKVVGSTAPPFGSERVFVIDTFLLVVGSELAGFSVLSRRDLHVIDFAASQSRLALEHPGLFRNGGHPYFVVPGDGGGLLLYGLDPGPPRIWGNQVYPITGEVTALAIKGDYLVAGGVNGWCTYWKMSSQSMVDSGTFLFNIGGTIAQIAPMGLGVVTHNTAFNKINLIKDTAGRLRPHDTYFLGIAGRAMYWHSSPLYGFTPVAVWNTTDLYLYRFSDDLQLDYKAQISVPMGVKSACIVDSLLVVAVAKSGIQVYRIQSNYTLSYLASLPSFIDLDLLMPLPRWPSRLMGFASDMVVLLSLENSSAPQIDSVSTLPFEVAYAYLNDTLLFTTGPTTTAVWSIPQLSWPPILLGSNNHSGTVVAGDNQRLFLTNGKAIYAYDLRGSTGIDEPSEDIPESFALLGNYPNPFNPSTTIDYSVPVAGHVQLVIYNALGQRVRVLIDRWEASGNHRILWDGRDEEGHQMASGTYFSRLTLSDGSRTGKMLLIR